MQSRIQVELLESNKFGALSLVVTIEQSSYNFMWTTLYVDLTKLRKSDQNYFPGHLDDLWKDLPCC